MPTISKTSQKLWPVWLTVALVLSLWIGSKWYFQDPFDIVWKYPAKAASLTASTLMVWCVVLATRMQVLEDFFDGLDKVYQVHRRLGRWAFFIILLHPFFLAVDRLPDMFLFLQDMWFIPPEGDRYLWGQNIGVAALLFMSLLVVLTLWITPAYHIWKKTHEWFGLVLVLVMAHVFAVDADVAAYPLLRYFFWGLLILSLGAFVYIRFLYRFVGPHYRYVVSTIQRHGDVLKINFAPLEQKMDFKPSQFVYLVVDKPNISREPHPYSIASGYNLEASFRLGIKKVGDHTRSLDRLQPGDHVTVYGPYGRFSDPFLSAERDCVFIGAGIGITPFLGMWHVALHSEERLPLQDVPQRLRRMHPEIIRSWKSPRVSLFYLCSTPEDASFDSDIRNEVIMSHFHGFETMEERGHHYEPYISSRQGRLTAEYVHQKIPGGVTDKFIFLCGPVGMTDSLIAQFTSLGVQRKHIVIEDFNLL
ncbi:MAG: ferric reductase-like transmembrane domain-containing protein [Desulfovibrionales bacterium]